MFFYLFIYLFIFFFFCFFFFFLLNIVRTDTKLTLYHMGIFFLLYNSSKTKLKRSRVTGLKNFTIQFFFSDWVPVLAPLKTIINLMQTVMRQTLVSVAVQAPLILIGSEPKDRFSHGEAQMYNLWWSSNVLYEKICVWHMRTAKAHIKAQSDQPIYLFAD